jgi:hypothetical protein
MHSILVNACLVSIKALTHKPYPLVNACRVPIKIILLSSVWDPETSRERIGDWGGPETVWALLCVAERRATRPNGEWGYSTRRHMPEPERPEAV